MTFEPRVYSVKEFNELVNTVLSTQVGEVTITGEISGYQIRQNKWVYFDLKDGESVLNCFASVYQLDMPLADGQKVQVTGTPKIYVPWGKYSLTARSVQLIGEGALQKAFEDLKRKLTAEGLFNPEHKRPLPRFPESIGIITSGDGAAINDICKVIDGRWGGIQLYLIPVTVQGKNAPDELVGALNYFNQHHPVDVIIFGRGGGSLEDLQAFNSERVARAIFSSRIPIVSGIGHEHNTSICDLVADVRAATPSNAAELAVPDRETIRHHLERLRRQAVSTIASQHTHARHTIAQQRHSLQLFASSRVSQIRLLIQRLNQSFESQQGQITRNRDQISRIRQGLLQTLGQRFEQSKHIHSQHQKLLVVLNPKSVLSRGYSITYQKGTDKPITCLADIPTDGRIETHVSDGTFESSTIPLTSQATLF